MYILKLRQHARVLGQLRELANYKGRAQSLRPLVMSDIHYKFGNFPRGASPLIICHKDSQKSRRAITLTLTVYYRERIEIKTS